MHPFKLHFVLVILIFISFSAEAQDGTIKVQRNPVIIDSSIWCGGILQRSWLNLELSYFQPLYQPQDKHENYSINDFIMQNGLGAHIILSTHRSQFNFSRTGSLGLSLVTGFDHFWGKEGDSLVTNVNADQYHYQYSFNRIPLNLRLSVSAISRPKFFLGMILEGGGDLLFTKFSWTPNSFKKTEAVYDFGVGFTLGFRYGRRGDHVLNFSLKEKNIGGNWFEEADLVFRIFYGKDRRR